MSSVVEILTSSSTQYHWSIYLYWLGKWLWFRSCYFKCIVLRL